MTFYRRSDCSRKLFPTRASWLSARDKKTYQFCLHGAAQTAKLEHFSNCKFIIATHCLFHRSSICTSQLQMLNSCKLSETKCFYDWRITAVEISSSSLCFCSSFRFFIRNYPWKFAPKSLQAGQSTSFANHHRRLIVLLLNRKQKSFLTHVLRGGVGRFTLTAAAWKYEISVTRKPLS